MRQTAPNIVPILLTEDTNSNLQNTQINLQKLSNHNSRNKLNHSPIESTNILSCSLKVSDISNSLESDLDTTLNGTQLTCLDNSFPASLRKNPPCLGPNG